MAVTRAVVIGLVVIGRVIAVVEVFAAAVAFDEGGITNPYFCKIAWPAGEVT